MGTDRARKRRKPIELGPAWSILLVPLLPLIAIAAVFSIPISRWQMRRARQEEQKFAETMRSLGRTLSWEDLQPELEDNLGWIVAEWTGTKGSTRWWWLKDGIGDADLIRTHEADGFYQPTDAEQWTASYTGKNGSAMLICASWEQKKTVLQDHLRFREGVNGITLMPVSWDPIVDELGQVLNQAP